MKLLNIKKFTTILFVIMLSLVVFAGIVSASNGPSSDKVIFANDQRPIVIQGPMPVESKKLAGLLENVQVKSFGPYVFWIGTIDNYPVIVSKTLKGMSNTAAATAIAIEKFNPIAIINQGTSGGHDPSLNVYDIVIGIKTLNGGAMKTGKKALGEGSNPLEWKPMDLLKSEGSAGEDPNALRARTFDSDPKLIEAAESVAHKYTKGKVVEGIVESADIWNSELDRINWFHDNFGTSVEEMEGASAAQISSLYNVPFLSIRILSNNATNGGKYVGLTGEDCQGYVYEVVKAYINTLK